MNIYIVLISIFIGFFMGFSGGGGSILTIPTLVYILGINPLLATTYSMIVIGMGSVVAFFQNLKYGLISYRVILFYSIPSMLAIYSMRTWVMPQWPDEIPLLSLNIDRDSLILILLSIVMLIASTRMLNRQTSTKQHTQSKSAYHLILQSFGTGVLLGILGTGGGFLIVPILIFSFGLTSKQAIANSLGIITLNSIVGVSGDLYSGVSIDWRLIVPFSLLCILGSLVGGVLKNKVSDKLLNRIFGFLILGLGSLIILTEVLIQ